MASRLSRRASSRSWSSSGEGGEDVAVGVFAAWLYDRWKNQGEGRRSRRVNRVMVEVTPEAITKVLTESVQIEERK